MVNQKVAMKMLEKYGHIVDIVENGQLAVDAVKARVSTTQRFDVILVCRLLDPHATEPC